MPNPNLKLKETIKSISGEENGKGVATLIRVEVSE